MHLISCPDSIANVLGFIDTTIAPRLLFYSYIPIVLLTLFMGFLVYFKDKKSLVSKLFLGIAVSFALWILLILLQWIGVHVQVVHFAWQMLALFEVLIFIFSLYFSYVYLNGRDISNKAKHVFFVLTGAIIVLIPLKINIAFFDFENCAGVIGKLWHFIYGLEIVTILAIIYLGVKAWRLRMLERSRSHIALFIIGISTFLILFSGSNIIGEITQTYQINLFGSFGMIVFISVLGYMIVRYKSFNIRAISAQVLIFALSFLIFSLIFIERIDTIHTVALITLALVLIIGRILVRGVRREIEQRTKLELLSNDLASANEKLKSLDKLKTEFLSLASHQLRTPLTAIKGYASMMFEGSFGKMDDKQSEAAKRIYTSAQGLANIVEDLLNVSKIEQGGMKYEMMPTDVAKLVRDLYNEMKIPAENKKLAFTLEMDAHDSFMATADPLKLKQVFLNLTDNSIKYTEAGFVKLGLARKGTDIVFSVTDSGVGVTPETKTKLFDKFARGEGGKMNTGGSGLGLYLAREITRAHKGDVEIISDGAGKGAIFKVTIPGTGAGSRGVALS